MSTPVTVWPAPTENAPAEVGVGLPFEPPVGTGVVAEVGVGVELPPPQPETSSKIATKLASIAPL